jgi:hypothetical protein
MLNFFKGRATVCVQERKNNMLFLIEYDRRSGHIVTLAAYVDAERRSAEDSRLELELSLNRRGIEHEVVILEAASEEALRRTHRRYFEDLADLTTALAG